MNPDYKNQFVSIVKSQSQCPPAERMYWLYVWIDEEGEIRLNPHPVLALRTEHLIRFTKRFPVGQYDFGDGMDVDELIESGWSFCGRETEIKAVILDDEYGLIDCDDPLMKDESYSTGMLVICPWPHDEARDKCSFLVPLSQLSRELKDRRKKADEKKLKQA